MDEDDRGRAERGTDRARGEGGEDQEESQQWWKYAGLGFEFVGVTLLFGYMGSVADRKLGTGPRWMLISGGFGLVGGLYLMIKACWPLFRDKGRNKK